MKNFFRKAIKLLPVILATILITLLSAFLLLGGDVSRIFTQVSLIKKVTSVDTLVNNNSIYFTSNSDETSEEIVKTYISMIDDDYAFYFDKADLETKNNEREGLAEKSIGVSIAIKDGEDYPTAVYVHSNSPAKLSGVEKGDKILSINGVSLKGKSTEDAVNLIDGDKVKLKLKRKNRTLNISVKPDTFTYDSVIPRMIGSTCVIKITEFEESTVSQFNDALEFLKDNNADSVIFDLRNNPGGYVDACVSILDQILPKGDTVRTKDKNGKISVIGTSDDKKKIDLPMAVLVNGSTASAAEIFAVNIRDFEKGKLVGENTFGKGIVQTTYKLSDGTAVKFTTATVVDKNGNSYHKSGLSPDVKVEFTDEQNENYLFLSDDEDTQLQKALTLLND